MKRSLFYSSAEKMFDRRPLGASTRYKTMMNGNKYIQSRENKPGTSHSKVLPSINDPKYHSLAENMQRLKSDINSGNQRIISLSPRKHEKPVQDYTSHSHSQNPRLLSHDRYRQPESTPFDQTGQKVIHKHKVQFRKYEDQRENTASPPKDENRFLYIIPEGSDITSPDLTVIKVNLTDYVKIYCCPNEKHSKFLYKHNVKYQRLGIYEKLLVTKPSQEMQNQVFRIILQLLERSLTK